MHNFAKLQLLRRILRIVMEGKWYFIQLTINLPQPRARDTSPCPVRVIYFLKTTCDLSWQIDLHLKMPDVSILRALKAKSFRTG